jgi:toxin FitB
VIIIDTNIISEMMKTAADRGVVEWLNRQDTLSLYLTTSTIAEIKYGLGSLPNGKRRRAMEQGFERLQAEAFEGRIWSFDLSAALQYGLVMSERRAKGRPLGVVDGQIAAVARSRGAAIATRNVRDFDGCGVKLVDPFAE